MAATSNLNMNITCHHFVSIPYIYIYIYLE